jgi:hypothetical protein
MDTQSAKAIPIRAPCRLAQSLRRPNHRDLGRDGDPGLDLNLGLVSVRRRAARQAEVVEGGPPSSGEGGL